MIDVHTHVLPGIDDGSQSVEESRLLLEESAGYGVTQIAATPHFYAHKTSFDHFLEKRERALQRVLEAKESWNTIPQIYVGAEVYYFPGMGRAERLKELTYKGSDILLLEMPFAQWDTNIVKDVEDILQKQKLRIILAHVERYYGFQKKMDAWNTIMQMDITPQINCECLLHFRTRGFAIKLLKQRDDVLLGTDCHNMKNRLPNMKQGREVIEKKLGTERIAKLDKAADRIFTQNESLVRY